tara:strand:+ start:29900 stop:30115 length:216 start_codon:yes stop_codon:yes gene_type:complete
MFETDNWKRRGKRSLSNLKFFPKNNSEKGLTKHFDSVVIIVFRKFEALPKTTLGTAKNLFFFSKLTFRKII